MSREYVELSQWTRSPFTHDGKTFMTAEQFMMYSKAMLFNDTEMANMMLSTPQSQPSEHKKLGRMVRSFVPEVWDNECVRIVAGVNSCKFTQNERLMRILVSTGNKVLVEASPYNRIWWIEFDATHALVNRKRWGENRLGKSLMMVRDEMMKTMREKAVGEGEEGFNVGHPPSTSK
ncbi:DUF1768-domain-containing protein [Mytilinidion resinicola]|uniref:DUF1768-domain-containing protein n=1 Tax=Mytilinidion resinicola TaxID=574789 RepID=A0A6A6Y9I6_9PEZI|nr:DUF1768-domain-containing protein [Mytilinidion resinicola]KAF2805213.1 DUF1768-domain-containing protein [Mytilinidion resinicola]